MMCHIYIFYSFNLNIHLLLHILFAYLDKMAAAPEEKDGF